MTPRETSIARKNCATKHSGPTTATSLEDRIRESYYETVGRPKMAEQWRYFAKFARNDTAFVYFNLRADLLEKAPPFPNAQLPVVPQVPLFSTD